LDGGPRQITLELLGPAGTQVLIDEVVMVAEEYAMAGLPIGDDPFGPAIRCISHCADIAGIHYYSVGPEDYLAAVYSIGHGAPSCVDSEFARDGVISIEDVEYFDWVAAYPAICSCADGSAVASQSLNTTASSLGASGCAPEGAVLIAGKTYTYDPYAGIRYFSADRIFGFDNDFNTVGEPLTWGDDRLNTRLANDRGTLYQLNVRRGLVRLSDGLPVLPRGCLPYEGNDVYIGWHKEKGSPPLQDVVFDTSGDVYVVPVIVIPKSGEPHRAAARIRLGPENEVVQLYDTPLFASGVHEIEIDREQNVFVLDKRHWDDSVLLCYDRDSGVLEESQGLRELLGAREPSAFLVSQQDGRILFACDNDSLVQIRQLQASSLWDLEETEISGMSYVTDMTEEDDTGTIWIAGFRFESMPNPDNVRNGATLFQEPRFKPVLAKIAGDPNAPCEVVTVSNYEPAGKEYLSLPLSIVCTGNGG
jgi:hypothetical protein